MLGVTSSLLFFCFWVFVIFMVSYQWKRRHLYLAATKMVGPPTVPIFGNALLLMCKNEKILWRIHKFVSAYSPGPIRFWLGPLLLVIIPNPKHVEKILPSSKFFHKFDGIYKFPKIFLGEGLIFGNGSHLKSDRKVLQPMLDLSFIQKTLDILNTHIEICMKNMESKVEGPAFDICHYIHPCIGDYVKEVILGSKERSQITGTSEFDEAMMSSYEVAFTRMVKAWQHVDFIFNFTPIKEKQDRFKQIIRRIGKIMMVDAFNRRNTPNPDQFHAIIDSMVDYADENPDYFTEERFIDHILTLYTAAEDTISQISAFFAVCMGMYPEYQEKAAQEVRDIFGDTPRPVTADDVPKLIFINMCLKEVLRLYPAAPIITRNCSEDFLLDDWVIPKGAALVVSTFSIQRDPEYWEKPNSFYPEHFLPEAEAKRPNYAYIPFSIGQRGCIGKTMAMYVLKVFACNLLQRFEIDADGKVETFKVKMDISVRPVDACRVRFKKRVWKM